MAAFGDVSTTKRQLTIKTGVVKRLAKEESSYVTEAQDQEERIAKFIDDGRDEYDLKQQRSVLQDTLKMIPDCRKRLELATDELLNFLEGLQIESQINTTSEFITAKEVLVQVQDQIQTPLSSLFGIQNHSLRTTD
ncbi:related to Tubulin-specific chaperone A [Melanopsichium pennsylvanicum]|uniref:Tubulin-specific chaperone A n=1 Tax=Melanopsichium pennsylvanicum TaxID=63383 RepID=A0AAJ4XKA2_9BASI|nr:related to Tubulin-specific chaperone A [Melanopsichium pennsylvanicum]